MKDEDQFEVLDSNGERHRWQKSDGYFWQWRAKDEFGTPDYCVVEVLHESDGDIRLVKSFPNPAAVGEVNDGTIVTLGCGIREQLHPPTTAPNPPKAPAAP